MTILVFFISKTINNTAFNKLYINIEDFIEIKYFAVELTSIIQIVNYKEKLKKLNILFIYLSKSNISRKSNIDKKY